LPKPIRNIDVNPLTVPKGFMSNEILKFLCNFGSVANKFPDDILMAERNEIDNFI
jgi:hypothetical protein